MERDPTDPVDQGDMPSLIEEERLERLAERVNDGTLKTELDEAAGYDPDLMVD